MKGIILAGGLGTRLYPLTFATNKHLLPIFDQPMIFYPLKTLTKAGIDEVMIVVSGPHSGHFINVLKNGEEFGLKHLEYGYQSDAVGGIADALAICKDFADNDSIAVVLGDNTTDADISLAVASFTDGAMVFLKKVSDPKRFGVAVFDKKDPQKIVAIEEKPEKPKSSFAVTGLYLYDNQVFDYIKKCKPSERGQLEITDVNNLYIKAGKMHWGELKGFWSDAGTFESLFKASQYWASKKGIK
jgi:glucose-1-phosphate thymidylyltransferase